MKTTNRAYTWQYNLIYFIMTTMLCSCTGHVTTDYLHEFYQAKQEQTIHLIDGERAPLAAADLKFLSYYPYQNDYRVKARFRKADAPEVFEMATYSGQTKEFAKIGSLYFKLHNAKRAIHVYQSVRYANHPIYGLDYFNPFKDLTSGDETYGVGRYIDIKKSMFNSSTVQLDFNKAYNPWCAYADGYNCPIPPMENDLAISIKAGERNFQKDKNQ